MIKVRALKANQAEILIYDPIGENWFGDGFTAKRFIADLEELGNVDDIKIRINSPGGEVFDGFAIYNALKNHPAEIHVQIDGVAASIASVIAMAGDLITMGDGAMIMIHDPWSIAIGDAEDFRGAAEMLDKIKEGIIDAYAGRTGLKRDHLAEMMDRETWFTVEESIENGFADERMQESVPATIPAAASAAPWAQVMAKFRNAPADVITPRETADSSTPENTGTFPDREQIEMNDKVTQTESVKDADEIRKTAVAQGVKDGIAKEQNRRVSIRNAFGRHADNFRPLLDECMDDINCTVETAQAKLLAKLADGAEPLAPGAVEPVMDARDKFRTGAAKALLSRTGHETRESGNEFNGMHLAQMAGHALKLAGVNTRGLSNNQLALKVMAAQSTSDFPLILSNVAGKMLRAAYGAYPSTYQIWCAVGEVSDFKANPRLQMGSFNNLAVIPEGGEYTYGSLTEEGESITAATKGKMLQLTRQMIVNDDLGAFNRRAMLLGRAAARTVNNDVYELLTSGASNNGPTMSDTGQLFNSTAVTTAGGHANLAGSGGAPSVATISAGRAAMRKQKDAGLKDVLNIMPRTILGPVVLEDTIWAILNSTADPASSNSRKANYVRDVATLELVTDPFLDGISATGWYLAADPMDAPLIEVDFLDGEREPFIDESIDWQSDAMEMKVRLDYGLSAIDWRGGYRNAGA